MLEHVDTMLSFAVVMLLLSLLVTALVQIVVAAFAQRTRVLKLGIERLLTQVAPSLQDHAPQIADAVRCHPTVVTQKSCPAAILEKLWLRTTRRQTAAVGKEPATAIQGEELIRLLDDLATSPTSVLPDNVKTALAQVMGIAGPPELKALADRVQSELEKVFPIASEVAQIKRIVDQARERTRRVTADVTTWFSTVMDRTADEFRNRIRWTTVAFAVVLSFVFHVDSLQILRQLASDPQLRAKVMLSTDAAFDKAAEVFSLAEGTANLASTALQQTCKDHPEIAAAYGIDGKIPAGLATRRQGDAWLDETLKEPKDPNHPELFLATYHRRFDEIAGPNLESLLQRASQIKASLDESTLTIFAVPETWKEYWDWWNGMHLCGTLMTAVFLSLGAPFWYNALKQLSNLRPAIAQKIDLASQPKE